MFGAQFAANAGGVHADAMSGALTNASPPTMMAALATSVDAILRCT
jgi:ABC-type nitrate/sulfonate/bicarbonate transport system substrate-binding protein